MSRLKALSDFNPRAREGRDGRKFIVSDYSAIISIHAPVKGATISLYGMPFCALSISIHAPVKGATGRTSHGKAQSNYFNPRAREGRDLSLTQAV